MIGCKVPREAVSLLRSATSGADKTVDWMALVWLPVSLFAVIYGVSNRSQLLIGSAALAIL